MKAETVYRLHLPDDQGGGVTICSNCGYDLSQGWYPCPGCEAEWKDTKVKPYSFGGSDF